MIREGFIKRAMVLDPGIAGHIAGMSTGYYKGRDTAGSAANMLSSRGHKTKNEELARSLATITAPVGAIGALILAKKKGADISKLIKKTTDDPILREILSAAVPFSAAAAGGIVAGGATGAITSIRGM